MGFCFVFTGAYSSYNNRQRVGFHTFFSKDIADKGMVNKKMLNVTPKRAEETECALPFVSVFLCGWPADWPRCWLINIGVKDALHLGD